MNYADFSEDERKFYLQEAGLIHVKKNYFDCGLMAKKHYGKHLN